jgi:hypothetical protein
VAAQASVRHHRFAVPHGFQIRPVKTINCLNWHFLTMDTLSEPLRNLWYTFTMDRIYLVQVLEGKIASALVEVAILPLIYRIPLDPPSSGRQMRMLETISPVDSVGNVCLLAYKELMGSGLNMTVSYSADLATSPLAL